MGQLGCEGEEDGDGAAAEIRDTRDNGIASSKDGRLAYPASSYFSLPESFVVCTLSLKGRVML
jgi:hypothetical protein